MTKLKELEQHMGTSSANTDMEKVLEMSLPNESIQIREELLNEDKLNYTTIHSNINGIVRKYVVKHRKTGSVRWYICSSCAKDFKKPSDLIRHIRTHTKEKPFKVKAIFITLELILYFKNRFSARNVK